MDVVAIYSTQPYERQALTASCKGRWEQRFLLEGLHDKTALLATGARVVSLFVEDLADRQALQRLADLGVGMVSLRCTGHDKVDLAAAEALGLTVTYVPGYSPHAVAEFALLLLLALLRKLPQTERRVQQHNFSLAGLEGLELRGRVVGVVGCGNIGRVFAELLIGCGATVLVYDPFVDPKNLPGEPVSLETLLARSEIVSLHCPLVPATSQLINERSLSQMREGAFLINTGRGGLVDTNAVERALASGKLAGFAMDVFEREQGLFFHDHSKNGVMDAQLQRLLELPNVIVTGHQAFLTQEALAEIAATEAENIAAFLGARQPPHVLHAGR